MAEYVNSNSGTHTVVAVTGASGMIGSQVIKGLLNNNYHVIGLDRCESQETAENYKHIIIDLSDSQTTEDIFNSNAVDCFIHLAALAHTAGESNLSWEKYYQLNVANAANVFKLAAKAGIPILFISTADVYGIVHGVATAATELHPIGDYGKSKALAEAELKRICAEHNSPYTVFRFAPVYTETVKRDIQKRYYLKYPNIAYLVGGGTEYEVLDIKNAVNAMVEWVEKQQRGIFNIKNAELLNTAECIERERSEGRAKTVLRLPRGLVKAGFGVIKLMLGAGHSKVYLLNKVVNPLRTE